MKIEDWRQNLKVGDEGWACLTVAWGRQDVPFLVRVARLTATQIITECDRKFSRESGMGLSAPGWEGRCNHYWWQLWPTAEAYAAHAERQKVLSEVTHAAYEANTDTLRKMLAVATPTT